jgi:hypothetical protein
LRAIPTIIDRECFTSSGHARITISKSASTAALSAAPLDDTCEFPDDFARCASPVSPTRCKLFLDQEFLTTVVARTAVSCLLRDTIGDTFWTLEGAPGSIAASFTSALGES